MVGFGRGMKERCEFRLAAEQTGTVADYCREFVTRLTHLGRKEESLMVRAFLRGLKEEIKTELKMLGPLIWVKQCHGPKKLRQRWRPNLGWEEELNQPKNLTHLITEITQLNPTQFNLITDPKITPPKITQNPPHNNAINNSRTPYPQPFRNREFSGNMASCNNPIFEDRIRRLTDKEFREKRAKGLYF